MKNGSSANKGQFQKTGTSILGIIVVLTMILSSCAPAGLGSVDQPNFSTSNDDTLENSNPASSPSVTNTPSPAEIPYEPIKEPVVISVPEEPVPAQVVIQFNKDATEEEKEAYLEEIGGVIVEDIDSLDTVIVSVPEEIASNPLPLSSAITQTESDYYVSALDSIPNDPQYSEQWALSTIGAASVWGKLPIDAEKIRIAVIDSGICSTHPDLDGRIVAGWDFVEGDSIPQDEFGHGCAVAGIIAANMNDSLGIAGIAPNAQIMPLRALDENGIGTYSNVAAAIVYAADNDAQIINVSLGGSNSSSIMENAINYAISKDVIIVAAAGNSGTQGALYPAAYQGVIAVGSIDPNLQHSRFSNYGPQIDLWAPGRDILSVNLEGGYDLFSGTSFSAPHVAGAKAMELALGTPLIVGSNVLSFVVEPSPTDIPDNTSITLTPLPTLAPIDSPVDTASAGNGTLFRTQVKLKYPVDQARLEDWGIKILSTGDRTAVIQATDEQLEKLARLGFEPTQIDSVEYMLAVQSSASVTSMSLSEVTASSTEMMALASVDSDSDGLTDTEETWWCTNPNDNNSDSALAPSTGNPSDGDEVQAIKNRNTSYGPPFALWPQFTPQNPNGNCPDGDYDAVPDSAEEFVLGSSILRESTDLDKFDDGQEFFGRTYCPAPSGPCGYGILPRAEDSAYVSSLLPSFVLAPGNDPFVAAFPEPEVEVATSSIVLTQKTVITNTNGTTIGTEKTYGTSTTKGSSTSLANTVTWNSWQEVSEAKYDYDLGAQGLLDKIKEKSSMFTASWKAEGQGAAGACANLSLLGGCLVANTNIKMDKLIGTGDLSGFSIENVKDNNVDFSNPFNNMLNGWFSNIKLLSGNSLNITFGGKGTGASDFNAGGTGTLYSAPATTQLSSPVYIQPYIEVKYPALQSSFTSTSGTSHGGAQTTTTSEYQEETISNSSTNQYSDNWSTSTAVDSTHAADLRFTYNIVNNGTEYAREVTNLTFNIYIGNNPNPVETYVAINGTTKPKIQNLFPGNSVTYTSEEIWLTLDEMRAIDEGASIRIVMEDISFGQDQVFYEDAFNGSVLLAMEDGFDDSDETIDSYLIPVWDSNDTVQDVAKRYFPVTEDTEGNLLSISTPEFTTNPPTFVEHSLTGTSWWNIYLSEGLTYVDAFKDTTASPNSSVLIRIVTDSDLDGYNNRNEIRIGTDPDDPASHPSPNLVAGYTKSCTGNDCTVRMAFQNLGNYNAYGVEAIMYTPDGQVNITNNTIGGSGRVNAGEKVIVSASDTFQYTKTVPSPKEPVIVVSYNDPQGNHRFILPASALLTTLNDNIAPLNGQMLPDPGVDIASTSATNANFVIFSPHAETITNGKLFVEYIDAQGNVIHEDVFTQNFASGPTVVPVSINTGIYPPESTILLAFFTDAQGNIIDSSARPLASFGADPLPEANVTTSDIEIGAQGVVEVPNPWNFGTVESGTTLYANITLGNTGMGDLRYSLSGWGNGVSVMGVSSGSLSASNTRQFAITIDTAGLPNGAFSKTLTLRTNDPNHAVITINLTGTIGTPAGTATAYQVTPYQPWNQFVYVPGPHNQNDIVNFTHTLADDPSRMFPLYLYNEDGTTLKGVGEYGIDFSGQTAPFGVFGTGADGDLTVTTGQTIYTDNTRSAVSSTANSGQTNITLSSASGFAAGQEVLIIQMQGTGAGNYEFANIASVSSNTLTLTKNLTNAYTTGGNSKAQVIRVMQYHDVTVQSGGILTAHAWDGNTGGVVVFRATGTTTVNGQINATVLGYRGGQGGTWSPNNPGGGYGESYTASFQGARNEENTNSSANGGAGRGGIGRFGGGDGRGGGGGSYGDSPLGVTAPNGGGAGGSAYGTTTLSPIYLGSGGGGGGKAPQNTPNSLGGNGGRGGGMVIVYSRTFDSSVGYVYANGGSGGNCTNSADESGGGGGGSGGSILIKSNITTIGSSRLNALGGGAGSGCKAFENGAPGGAGRIRVEYGSGSLTGISNPSASIQQITFYSITGQGAPFGVFGNGSDGNLTIVSGQTYYVDNLRSIVANTTSSGQNIISVASTSGFTVGQEILILQTQGVGAGSYEFASITNINGNTIEISHNLAYTYTNGGNSRAQVIRVPNYQNVTIQTGGTLTATNWDGYSGGVIAFRVQGTISIQPGGSINANGLGYRGGYRGEYPTYTYGHQGESFNQPGGDSYLSNNGGGGGGQGDYGSCPSNGKCVGSGGAGGSYGTIGTNGTAGGDTPRQIGLSGGVYGDAEMHTIYLGSGGGGGGPDNGSSSYGGTGGNGGGAILVYGRNINIAGNVSTNGNVGANGTSDTRSAGGGGGAGGSILIIGETVALGNNLISSVGNNGGIGQGSGTPYGGNGGAGGHGRIHVKYTTVSGSTNPVANVQQVNYYNMNGSSSNTLYVPDTISNGGYARYKLLYGQRSSNTSGGDQLYSVHLENRQYSSVTLSALIEQVVGSGSSFNFCLDFGNNGTCDYTANNQSFTGPVRLDSSNLAAVLNAYITGLGSTAPVLNIPIRVNINTQADVFLFNLSSTAISGVDLLPSTPTIAPQNGNAANNILEGSLVDLSATVTNWGSNEASDFIVAFYLGDPANGGTLIGSKFISSLAPGETSPAQTVTWNTSGLLGSKTIYVKADSSSAIGESNEANNTASAPAVIKKKPDLTILSIQAPNLRAGETGSASVTVKNDGQFDVTGAVVRLYLGTDANGTVLGNVNVNVPQGQSVIAQIPFSVSTAGNKNLFVKADPSNVIAEANEQNNTAAGNITIGWNLLTVDAGGANDTSYSPSTGYGWLAQGQGTTSTSCGTQLQQSYRQAGSTETLQYQFDNLIPGRHYHLDVTFATCSGERYLDLFVDGTQMTESQAGALPGTGNLPIYVNNSPQTISLLLDPASYESDGSVTLSISRNSNPSSFSGPLVNIIDLQEVKYCYMDSGPNEAPWSASNDCGYDPSWSSDSFNGWGALPYETMRFGDGSVNYKFSNLIPTKKYNLRMVYYEEDSAGRIQRVTFDGASPSATFTLGSTAVSYIMPIPAASYSDGQLIVAIERPAGGEAVINEIILEEDSRIENNRYNTPAAAFNKSAPLNTATDQSVNTTLSWAASSGATSYEYCYDTTNDNSCSSWTGNGLSTSKPVSGLEAGTTYYWHVRALKGSTITYANGSATAFWSFTTAANSNGAFNKTSPANGAPNQSTSPTLSWGISNGATLYEYCYDTTNDNSCSNWAGNGTSTSKALSGLSSGTTYYWHVRAVNGGVITYSNTNAFWSFTVISDNTPPTVTSIIRASTTPTSATNVDFTVTFSEAVQNVDANGSDFTLFTSGVTGASITGVSGSGSIRTVTVNTGSGNGSIRLDVPNTATIKDIYNNDLSGLPFTNGESYAIEKIITPPNHTVTFDANGGSGSMGNQVANIPTALTANTFTYSGYSFTGWNTAANGSGTSYANGATYSFDADVTLYAQWVVAPPPHVNSITRASTTPSSAASVDFTVTFSEDITGISTSDPLEDFELYTTGVSGAFITVVTPVSASVYTVAVNTGSGNGTIRLDIPDTATIFASSNNAPIELPYSLGEEYTILKTTSATFKSSAANDGWILESSETSNSGGSLNSNQKYFTLGDDATNRQYRAILHFDTSALPDNAVVTNMSLKIKQQGNVIGTSPFSFGSLYVDMRNPAFGGSALELADFNFAAKKVKSAIFNPNPVSGWFSARFNNGGNLYVNRTGVSQIRLYFSVDDNNNNIADFIRFYSGNAAAGDRPKLVIQYYVP
jgi:thermitase